MKYPSTMTFLVFLVFLATPVTLLPSGQGMMVESHHLSNPMPSQLRPKVNELGSVVSTQTLLDITGAQWLIDQGFDGSGIRVSVIDTGVNPINDLQGRIVAAKSFVTVSNGYSGDYTSVDDNYNHGTKVASLVAGTTVGLAKSAEIINAKIVESSGTGNGGMFGEETSKGVVEAIYYSVEENATIINLSIGQYNNLVIDGRQYVIDKVSKEHNIIFTISAGNEGYGGREGGSIGTPGTSLQAITVGMTTLAETVGATRMNSLSSSGPRPDYLFKPDVVAPGTSLTCRQRTGELSTSCTGTSFSAPVTAGGVALLVNALQEAGVGYTPGTLKAALMATTTLITDNSNTDYPPWFQGTGLVNFTAAYELLMNSPTTDNIPQLSASNPKGLPVSPLDQMFQGQTLDLNLTVVTSGEMLGEITVEGGVTDLLTVPDAETFNDTSYLPIIFHPSTNTPVGDYTGNLTVTFQAGNPLRIPIELSVATPTKHVLFDETKNGVVNRYGGGLDDPWGEQGFLYGNFREFYSLMADKNISITSFRSGDYTNLSYLTRFDCLVFAYPMTQMSNLFTDWFDDPSYFHMPTKWEVNRELLFDSLESSTIASYLSDYGGGVLVLSTLQPYLNTSAMNSWLSPYSIKLVEGASSDETLEVDSNHPLFDGVGTIRYYGTRLDKTSSDNTEVLLDGRFVVRNFPSGGKLVVAGSGLFAENRIIGTVDNAQLVLNLVNWTATPELGTTTPAIDEFPVTSLAAVFVVATLVAIVTNERRKKA